MENNWHFLLTHLNVRKTQQQKTTFIEYICNEHPRAQVEQRGSTRNIVIGDVKDAKIILTAHYDTPPVLPFPNLIFPQNIFALVLSQLLIAALIFAIAFLAVFLTGFLWLSYILPLSLVLWMFFGAANPTNSNDNTSGVLTLLRLMDTLPAEQKQKVAFVFFDKEELGLVGSSAFKRKHKSYIDSKFVINFDCVGEGENFLFIPSKQAMANFSETLHATLVSVDGKNAKVTTKAYYPSDQLRFHVNMGVAALKKSKLFGLYLGKIHTPRDKVCDKSNIDYLEKTITALVEKF